MNFGMPNFDYYGYKYRTPWPSIVGKWYTSYYTKVLPGFEYSTGETALYAEFTIEQCYISNCGGYRCESTTITILLGFNTPVLPAVPNYHGPSELERDAESGMYDYDDVPTSYWEAYGTSELPTQPPPGPSGIPTKHPGTTVRVLVASDWNSFNQARVSVDVADQKADYVMVLPPGTTDPLFSQTSTFAYGDVGGTSYQRYYPQLGQDNELWARYYMFVINP